MNNLFKLSDGNQIQSSGALDLNEDNGFSLIPANTVLKAYISEAKWNQFDNTARFVALTWTVSSEQYNNRKIFQKLHVYDDDQKKSDRSRMMLAAIDKNCGSKLANLGRDPENMDLAIALQQKKMNICVDIWELKGKSGNWVRSVSPLNGGEEPKPQEKTSDFDDDIPF